MEGTSVMTVLGDPGDSRDYPLSRLLPARDQWEHVVEHGSIRPDGRPTYRSTRSDQMMHLSLLTEYVISMGHVEECTTSSEGMSVPYVYIWGYMAHAENDILIIFQFSHNILILILEKVVNTLTFCMLQHSHVIFSW